MRRPGDFTGRPWVRSIGVSTTMPPNIFVMTGPGSIWLGLDPALHAVVVTMTLAIWAGMVASPSHVKYDCVQMGSLPASQF